MYVLGLNGTIKSLAPGATEGAPRLGPVFFYNLAITKHVIWFSLYYIYSLTSMTYSKFRGYNLSFKGIKTKRLLVYPLFDLDSGLT